MLNCPLVSRGLAGYIRGVAEMEPKWDYGRCRLDGLNGFLLHCRESMNLIYARVRLIGHDKLPLSVKGIRRVNMWRYGDRT